jgi:hypothetical protein
MSEAKHGDAKHGHGAPDAGAPDSVDYSKVIGVGVASLVLFAVSIWVSALMLHSKRDAVVAKSGEPRPVMVDQTEIGIVDQVPFVSDHRLPKWQAERKAHLEGYGWIDKSKGLAHIPIEQAMEQVISGGAPAGAPK